MGTAATPDYGDPNRLNAATDFHEGQMFINAEMLLMVGVRSGSAGLIPMQLKMVPMIDDTHFTLFQMMNAETKAFADDRPFDGAGATDTEVTSAIVTGIRSTVVDGDVDFASAEYGAVFTQLRGFLEGYAAAGASSFPDTVPGATTNAEIVPVFQDLQGLVVGNEDWLEIPVMTNPAEPGYYVPVQNDERGWPINRNGQIRRVTATSPANDLQRDGYGAGVIEFTVSQTNVSSVGADVYNLRLMDGEDIADDIYYGWDDPIRGRPDLNDLWKIYGSTGGAASVSVTLPFIQPRIATLDGVNARVPDPFQDGNFDGQLLEWNLEEHILDTNPTGIDGLMDWNDLDATWFFEATDYTAIESQRMIWQD
jgi:hypothetical protein